jgi:hypothetical protein
LLGEINKQLKKGNTVSVGAAPAEEAKSEKSSKRGGKQ